MFFWEQLSVTLLLVLNCFERYDRTELRHRMYFQLDGVPPHFLRTRRNLDMKFPNIWTGRGGTPDCAPRTSDVTPVDIFYIGLCKQYSDNC